MRGGKNLFVLVLVGLVTALVGCATSSTFTATTRRGPQCTAKAVIVSEEDLTTLEDAGGRPLGTVSSFGSAFNSIEDLAVDAAENAAKNGGTHMILVSANYNQTSIQTASARTQTTCGASMSTVNCTSTHEPAKNINLQQPETKFLVIRVSPDNWENLPRALRPR